MIQTKLYLVEVHQAPLRDPFGLILPYYDLRVCFEVVDRPPGRQRDMASMYHSIQQGTREQWPAP